ncbi:MAG: O-antigen ligase family protein [Pseudomonadota bacterium]
MFAIRTDLVIKVTLLLMLIIATRGVLWIWIGDQYLLSGASEAVARIFSQVRWLLMAVMLAIVFRARFRPSDLFSLWPILLLTAFFAVTTLWSIASNTDVIRGALRYFGVVLMAIALCHLADEDRAFRRLLWVAIGFVAVNVAMLLLPMYAIHMSGPFAGQFRGMYMQKNLFGGVGSNIFAILFVCAVAGERAYRRHAAIAAGLLFLLLAWAGSKTAIAAMIVSCGIGLLTLLIVQRRDARSEGVAFFFIALTLSVALGVAGFIAVVEVMNALDGVTFTGRTLLWDFSIKMGSDRPLLGFGLDGFWRRFLEQEGKLSQMGLWTIGSAHNGYLEAFLIGGFVGLGLVFLILAHFFLQLVRLVVAGGSPRLVMLSSTLLVQLIVLNMFETRITTSIYPDVFLIGVCLILAGRELRSAAQRRAARRSERARRLAAGAGPAMPGLRADA